MRTCGGAFFSGISTPSRDINTRARPVPIRPGAILHNGSAREVGERSQEHLRIRRDDPAFPEFD
jgi:hypothetical protein